MMVRFICALLVTAWTSPVLAGNWKVPTSAKSVRNPVSDSAANRRRAERLYAEHCTQCHGRDGKGDGKLQRVEYDLRDVVAPLADGEIYWKITHGVGQMPSHAGVLTDEERWLTVNHLRALVQRREAEKHAPARARSR